MTTFATKLHILLVCTIIAVGLYMYFLYKELKTFQDDMASMKKQMQGLLTCPNAPAPTPTSQQGVVPKADGNDVQVQAAPIVRPSTPQVYDNIDEDVMSVTSNEIKDILTNIQNVDEDDNDNEDDNEHDNEHDGNGTGCGNHGEPLEETKICFEDDIIMMEKKPWPDFSNMSEDDMAKMKYDDLRSFLRSKGVNVKGSKQELINKIMEVVVEK